MSNRKASWKSHAACAAAVGLCWALAAGTQARAQEPGAPPSDVIFGEEIDVRVVNLEVVVQDEDGVRVRDLRPEDFRVLVDGQEVEVRYFTEVVQGRATSSDGAETPPAVGEGEVVATNYVLFVDDDHTQVALRQPVLRGFADRLDALGPGDRVAVVVQSRNRLELLSSLTTDRQETLAALEELNRGDRFGGLLTSRRIHREVIGGPGIGAGYYSDAGPLQSSLSAAADRAVQDAGLGFSDVVAQGVGAGGAEVPPGQSQAIASGLGAAGYAAASDLVFESMKPDTFEQEARASILERDLSLSVNAVVSTMRALDPPEGRKVLLLLPGFWPTGEFRPYGRSAGLRTDLELLDGLIDTANLLGYTVYPMDQQAGAPNTRLWQNLRYIARDTGGRAFLAGSNVSALHSVADDTSNYYWLGFEPDFQRDDSAHDIEVEVLRSGVQVRGRRGYLDLARTTEADMEAQRLLLFPQRAAADVPRLRVRTGEPRSLLGRKMRVPVDIEIPLGVFAALPYGGQYLQRLEVRFATIDRDGWRAEQPAIPLEVRSDSAPLPDSVFAYRAEVTMRHRPHTLVVTVHDPVSGETAAARVEVKP